MVYFYGIKIIQYASSEYGCALIFKNPITDLELKNVMDIGSSTRLGIHTKKEADSKLISQIKYSQLSI